MQARSQDLEKGGGGGYFESVRSEQTTLTGIFIDLEAISDGLPENRDEISRKARKFNAFFRPKSGDLQKKKKRSSPKLRVIFRPKSEFQRFFPPKFRWSPNKKKKKKRSSPKLRVFTKAFFRLNLGGLQKKKKKRSSPISRLIFRPISQIQTFEGGLFSNGGAIFHFSQKIGLKSTKNMQFCILHKPMGGGSSPPP